MSRTDITIKPADKGSATVVMDIEWYLRECYRQLENTNFYEKTNEDRTPKVCKQVKRYVDGLLLDGFIEKTSLERTKIKPYVWWRYLDDIFMIWTGNEDELREFIKYLNNLHRTIKFTLEQSS